MKIELSEKEARALYVMLTEYVPANMFQEYTLNCVWEKLFKATKELPEYLKDEVQNAWFEKDEEI